jgi:hypothetical protein
MHGREVTVVVEARGEEDAKYVRVCTRARAKDGSKIENSNKNRNRRLRHSVFMIHISAMLKTRGESPNQKVGLRMQFPCTAHRNDTNLRIVTHSQYIGR